MNYVFVFNLLLGILPGIYIYFFPILHKKMIYRRSIVGIISLISLMLLTHILNDDNYIRYMIAILPFTYATYYAGKVWLGIIVSVLLTYEVFVVTSEQGFLQFFTYLSMISLILLLGKDRFHSLEGSRKLMHVLYNMISCLILIILFSLQFSTKVSGILEKIGIGGALFFTAIFIFCGLFSYNLIFKHEQALYYKDKYEKMKSSHDELQSWVQVIKHAPFVVMTVTREERVLYANLQACQKYEGFQQIENMERLKPQLNQILSEPNYTMISNLTNRVYYEEQPSHTILQHDNKDMLYSAIPIFSLDIHEIQAVALFVQDVTELEAYRRELDRIDRLSIVGEMAASITHEIRNPMAVVRGYVQLLQERSHETQRNYYNIILEELDRTNMIITDFLMLAQNKREQKFSNSLNEVISELVPLLQADANLRGQTLQVELTDYLPSFHIIESEMKQLLLNISRNGMDAMKPGGKLTITTAYVEEAIVLTISDNGIGIPDELKDRIFEPFYSSKSTGTGLGLPLCATIVQRYNGWIKVMDNRDQGTIFEISFPLMHQQLSG